MFDEDCHTWRVATHVRSTRRCAGTHCSVASATTPSEPMATLARLKSSGCLSADSSSVPIAGVTSFIETTISSTGGMPAPVPCAPTCMHNTVHNKYTYLGEGEGMLLAYADIKAAYPRPYLQSGAMVSPIARRTASERHAARSLLFP